MIDVCAKTTACEEAKQEVDSRLANNEIISRRIGNLETESRRLREALNADDQTLRLHLGEMTAQEMRTLRAGFRWVLARAALGGDA